MEEVQGGDTTAAQKRLQALEGMPVLKISDAAESLAAILIETGSIPKSHPQDALHIALAIVNGMDYLLTWNFHHINNARMKKEITKVAEDNGYECPVICSPEELEGE